MSSRDLILNMIAQNQPSAIPLPAMDFFEEPQTDVQEAFVKTLTAIGGSVIKLKSLQDIEGSIIQNFNTELRIVTTIPHLKNIAELLIASTAGPHAFEDVELAVIPARFGVAENGAVWVTEENLIYRVLPFICQHLAVVLYEKDIVANMHYAYEKIGSETYSYGTFIAGPSKTADIEQSLVLGAHGSRSMTIFLIG